MNFFKRFKTKTDDLTSQNVYTNNVIDNNSIYSKVFLWMFIGLLLTFATGYYVSSNQGLLYSLYSSGLPFLLAIIEIVLVLVLTSRLSKMSTQTAKVLFLAYSFVTGLTFSSLFYVYSLQSIMNVFLISAVLFLIFAYLGKTTNIDLTKLGSTLVMILLGLILVSIINIFLGGTALEMLLSYLFVIVFFGITAYDMQRLKDYQQFYGEDKAVILTALQLYLDFINIFIELLKLFGKNKD